MPSKVFVDFAPLRESREFRLLFIGQLVATMGMQLTVVAIPFQIYSETHSSLQVGAVSIAQLLPLIIGSLIGGSLGDALDRRVLLLVSTIATTGTSAALAFNALSARPAVWAIYVVSALAAGLTGLSNPARSASIPILVDKKHLIAALSFSQIIMQVGVVVGPAIAGLLIAHTGVAWVYGIDALTSVVAIGTTLAMHPIPPPADAKRAGFGSVMEGLRYIKERPVIQGTYIIDINAMVFGLPRALFPALAANVFHGGPANLGYLYAAPGAGALVGALTTGWVNTIRRRGLAIIVAVFGWGGAITVFGFSRTLGLSLALLAVAGWADVISAVLRNTVIQTLVPDRL